MRGRAVVSEGKRQNSADGKFCVGERIAEGAAGGVDGLRVGAGSGALGSRKVESSAPGRITAREVVIEGDFLRRRQKITT